MTAPARPASPSSAPAPAPATPGATGAAPRTLTRDDLLRLGRGPDPWAFLALAVQGMRQSPGDHTLMFLSAANFAKVGLVTPARELIAALPPKAQYHPDVRALLAALDQLPPDEIGPDERIDTARRNAEALVTHGVDLMPAFWGWGERARSVRCCRARDGNIVRRRAGGVVTEAWSLVGDLLGTARAFAERHFGPGGRPNDAPVTIEGADPPWVLLRVWEATPTRPDGYKRPIRVLQADPLELLDGLSLADLRGLIDDPRVRFFVGPGAGDGLLAHLRERYAGQVVGPVVPVAATRTRLSPPAEQVLAQGEREQREEHTRLMSEVRSIYGPRTRGWWSARYGAALSGGGAPEGGDAGPLRVLVATSRYSTYVQHASRDLAGALRRAGCEAQVLIEPDDQSLLSSVAYLRALAGQRPDLVVVINYTRRQMRGVIPPEVPFVCWVQDAMPHLFDASSGEAQGELDFLVGHGFETLFSRFGYPRERALAVPVVADAEKFHELPADDALRERLACEVAFVSNHAETPEAMHERLVREASREPAVVRAMERLLPEVRRVGLDGVSAEPHAALESAARAALRAELGVPEGQELPARALALVLHTYALPLADRFLRHQAIGWAHEIAASRGWRLRLFGRGWESHPRWSACAGGELAHGEALRVAYLAAAAHLHVSLGSLAHQRVMECALSGGLPLCRLHRSALVQSRGRALRLAARRGGPVASRWSARAEERHLGFAVADHPELLALCAQAQEVGLGSTLSEDGLVWLSRARFEEFRARAPGADERSDAGWLLGDLSQTTFHTRDGLERLLERAVRDGAWRARVSGGIARRVRRELTHDALVPRVLELVRRGLSGEPAPAETPMDAGEAPAPTGFVEPKPGGSPEAPARGDACKSTLADRYRVLLGCGSTHRAVRARFGLSPDDAARRAVAAGYAPPAWAVGAIGVADAMFLYDLIAGVRPERVIELGTASGASAALLLLALEGAGLGPVDAQGRPRVHTFDLHPRCFFDRSREVGSAAALMTPDLSRGLRVRPGETAEDAARAFEREPVTLAFIDADHRHPHPTADLLALLPALAPGAWVALHDIDLPGVADRHEAQRGEKVDWRQWGAKHLYDHWPFEKLRGGDAASNIGAVRVPFDRRVTREHLAGALAQAWEAEPDERLRRIVGTPEGNRAA